MRVELEMLLAEIGQGQAVSESLVRRVLRVENMYALPAHALKRGQD
jgi:hypothetical protein